MQIKFGIKIAVKLLYQKRKKLIISTHLLKHYQEKKIEYDILTSDQSSKMENHIISDKSIYIDSAGVIDSHDYMNHLFRIASNNCTFIFESKANEIKKMHDRYQLKIQRKNNEIETINASSIINCAGLNSYNIAKKIMDESLELPTLKFLKAPTSLYHQNGEINLID